nr:hypothetical protein [Streptomyces violaceoruber]
MSALQQHLLDIHRAARLSRPAPPPPGRHDGASLLVRLLRGTIVAPGSRRRARRRARADPPGADGSGKLSTGCGQRMRSAETLA